MSGDDDVTIRVSFDGAVELSVAEVWPDGDAPDDPTADDVVSTMGGKTLMAVVEAWNLSRNLSATVTVEAPNPNYRGDAVLFGDPPPETITTEAWL